MGSPHALELEAVLDAATPRLLALSDAASGARPGDGKWSPREIIGHLIDSASNNHQRFLRAQFRDDLLFDGYDQEGWVEAQGYAEAPWCELVGLWRAFNGHLARVMRLVPEDVRLRPRGSHNLDRIAMRPLPAGQAATLDYLMEDYVEHLKHHLRQILGHAW